jgi:hypothetical protein
MKAIDQMRERADATLAWTSYRSRCWLNTYLKDTFWPYAFRALPAQKRYILVWKQFICYIFQVFACRLLQRKQIYNLKFRPEEI